MPKQLAFLLFLFAPAFGFSQVFGGHPHSTDWKYIAIPSATIIFRGDSDSSANRIAALINRLNVGTDSSIGKLRRPISIVLQNRTTISNGYVALAPFRTEFYITPPANPFDLGSLNWVDQLALHEYRHVQQYSNFNKGGSRFFRFVLGEQGQALANALTIPDWFFEGDAVYQETIFSRQGRGRTASFFNGYRGIWDAGLNYSYMKLRNGSFKDYVPGHYDLGYLLVAYGREQYGAAFWKKTTEDAAAMKGLFYPFQQSFRHYSGASYTHFVGQALAASRLRLVNAPGKNAKKPSTVVDQENPVFTENGELIFLKSSYSAVPAFYISKGGKDEKIRIKDRSLDHYFSYAKGKIVYASYRPNWRWGWIDYSELQLLDIKTGRQKRLSKGSRYFSPSFSEQADSIIAVNIPVTGKQALHVLNKSGELVAAIPNNHQLSFFHPIFWKGKIVVAAKNAQSKMSLLLVDPANGGYTNLLPWSDQVIGFPKGKTDTLFFTMSMHEQDRLMALDMVSGKLFELAAAGDLQHTGRYQPTVFSNTLAYSRFTAAGYSIEKKEINQLNWQPVGDISNDTASDFGLLSQRQNGNGVSAPDSLPINTIRNYRKTTGFFNFHSWQPFYEDPEFTISLFGQNVLNTFQSELYGKYNRNEGFTQIGYTSLFGGFFPVLKGNINYTFDRRGRFENKTIYWNQLQTSFGFSLPFNLSKGRSISFLRAGSDLVYNKDYFREPEKSTIGNRSYWYMDHDFSFNHQVQQSRQEFNPRFAQTLHLNFKHAINLYTSHQMLETVNLYIPGFFSNHSIVLNFAAQQRDSSRAIRFSNDFPYARGYSAESVYRVMKWSINYQFPLLYPDLGAWNIVYLLRVRTNFFYDKARINDPALDGIGHPQIFRSAGNEMFFDTKWWNQLPVSFGIRYARLLDNDIYGGAGKNRWQFILPVNLIPGGINAKRSLGF